jgi:hypothetical protein
MMRQLRRRGEDLGLGSDLGDDLLRRIHPQARYLGQSRHRALMFFQCGCEFLLQLRNLALI